MPLSWGRLKKSWSGKVNEDADAWRRCLPRAGDVLGEAAAAATEAVAAGEAENAAADVACDCSQAAPCNSASSASVLATVQAVHQCCNSASSASKL